MSYAVWSSKLKWKWSSWACMPEHLVGEHLGGGGVEEDDRSLAFHDEIAFLRVSGVVDRELDLAVDLLGGDPQRSDLRERLHCVVGDLQHRASLCRCAS